MAKDRMERRTYRKSPGRQYGYEYNPLREQSGYTRQPDTTAQGESWTDDGGEGNDEGSRSTRRGSGPLGPRPNPRRTRQLLRQNILASKARDGLAAEGRGQEEGLEDPYELSDEDQEFYATPEDPTLYRNRRPMLTRGYVPIDERYDERYMEGRQARESYREVGEEVGEEEWVDDDLDYIDPDAGYDEEMLAERLIQPEPPRARRPSRQMDYDPYVEEEERPVRTARPERPAAKPEEKKKGVSRRKLLIGGALVAGGAVAAYELVPRIPGALQEAGTNIEHQLQDAFNRGVAAGGDAVRKEFLNSLDNLEGVSLEAAMGAAKLTRAAYDVFVSPLVNLAATVAGDFLSVTLNALITARGWLRQINEDSPTLGALQTVLENWVNQAHNMPKRLQAITDSDLDGAQAYLRGLQRMIQEEQAKLNGASTPTPNPTPKKP